MAMYPRKLDTIPSNIALDRQITVDLRGPSVQQCMISLDEAAVDGQKECWAFVARSMMRSLSGLNVVGVGEVGAPRVSTQLTYAHQLYPSCQIATTACHWQPPNTNSPSLT